MSNGSFIEIQQTYFQIEENFNSLYLACENEKQRDQLRSAYSVAFMNYAAAKQKVFHDNDPQVKTLLDQLDSAQTEIKKMLDGEKKIGKILNLISAAVHLSSSLISLAGA